MAAHNRHIRGNTEEILAPIDGNTVIEAGDFLFIDKQNGPRGVAFTNYVYPFSTLSNAATGVTGIMAEVENEFLGVAMESSLSGVTENISVATAGVFRYPLYSKGAVTIGALVSSVTMFSTTGGVSNQTIANGATTGGGSTMYFGYFTKSESGASFAEFYLRTAYNRGLAT